MAELLNKGDSSHGMHWNIFLSISVIMALSILIPNFLLDYSYFLAFLITIICQGLLLLGVEDYIIDWSKHTDIFGKNAVGMFQTFGYFSCYLVGLGFGRKLYAIAAENKPNEDKAYLMAAIELFAMSFVTFIVGYFIFEPTAPKLCNLAFIGYIIMMSIHSFFVSYIPERLIINVPSNLVFEGPGKTSRLIYFTIANLFTGIVNIIMDLDKQSIATQLTIIILYTLILHLLFLFLIMFKINVRFW